MGKALRRWKLERLEREGSEVEAQEVKPQEVKLREMEPQEVENCKLEAQQGIEAWGTTEQKVTGPDVKTQETRKRVAAIQPGFHEGSQVAGSLSLLLILHARRVDRPVLTVRLHIRT